MSGPELWVFDNSGEHPETPPLLIASGRRGVLNFLEPSAMLLRTIPRLLAGGYRRAVRNHGKILLDRPFAGGGFVLHFARHPINLRYEHGDD